MALMLGGSVAYWLILSLPVILIPFALMDDYHYVQADGLGLFRHLQLDTQLGFGRPMAALVLGLYSGVVSSLEGLGIIRLISAILTGLTQGWLAIFILRAGVGPLGAFAISALALSGPGFSCIVMWATAAPFVPGLLLSTLASELVYRSALVECSWRRSQLLLAAGASLVLSLAFYPPLGLFFSVPLLALILFNQGHVADGMVRRVAYGAGCVYVIGLVVFFFFMKVVYFRFFVQASDHYIFSVVGDWFGRVRSFIFEVTPISANLVTWHSPIVFDVVIGCIAVGLGLTIFERCFSQSRFSLAMARRYAVTAGQPLALSLMTTAHLLLAHDDVRASRVLASYQAALAVVFCWSILTIGRRVLAGRIGYRALANGVYVVVGCSVLAFGFAFDNMTSAALNGFLEFRHIRSRSLEEGLSDVNRVVVVKVPVGQSFIGTTRNNGFNWTTSDFVSTMIPAMVGYALESAGEKGRYVGNAGFDSVAGGRLPLEVQALSSHPSDGGGYVMVPFAEADRRFRTVVIDMRSLTPFGAPRGPAPQVGEASAFVSASSNGLRHDIGRAFVPSRYPNNFWEAEGFPVEVRVMYSRPRAISRYSFQTRDAGAGRMPRAWSLQGSVDGINWAELDRRLDVGPWSNEETKWFTVLSPAMYERYRFNFEDGNARGVVRIYFIDMK